MKLSGQHEAKSLRTFLRYRSAFLYILFLTEFERCAPTMIEDAQQLIDDAINEDTTYSSKPLDLRYQRTYAVKVCYG